jgi:uncharacterized protein with WD repeat
MHVHCNITPFSENVQQGPTVTPTEKKIKKLKDKLEQIEKLKEKQANGDKLEDNQVNKAVWFLH